MSDRFDPYDYDRIFDGEVEPPRLTPQQWFRANKAKVRRTAIKVGVVVAVLAALLFVYRQFDPAGGTGAQVQVQIPVGATTSNVASTLERERVVPSALAFRSWVKLKGGVAFQAGEYNFNKNSSVSQALAVLKAGPKPATDRLTIPEGLRLVEIAERVGELRGMSGQEFYNLATSGKIRSSYQPADSESLEGLLFPDTYLLDPSDNEETLLRRMVRQFEAQARLTGLDQAERIAGQTSYDALIIASLIEAEAKVDEDRGKISQVIQNRLYKAMPLQIDATVLYGLGNTKSSLSNSDLKSNSPYNTYKITGLPPTPICSPGAESIEAALRPTPGPWLYYVLSDANGAHAFSTTYEEHLANVQTARERGLL